MFGYDAPKKINFFSVPPVAASNPDDYDPEEGTHVRVIFRLDRGYEVYEREVYSVAKLLGDVGGLKSALFGVIGILISSIVSKLKKCSIAEEIYMV